MSRYRHCVITLTGSQLDPKFVVLLLRIYGEIRSMLEGIHPAQCHTYLPIVPELRQTAPNSRRCGSHRERSHDAMDDGETLALGFLPRLLRLSLHHA
jgi:hypothetical protein